jgi:hypothetical protein
MRKHFMGVKSGGSRRLTKQGMVKRAQSLGYMTKDEKNDNQADACGICDWLIFTHFRQLDMFG